ncbi:MAG: DUF4430 domain-containing protein [Chloroflexota bacterium]
MVAIFACVATVATTGCGFGAGADLGSVKLRVTRDYGATAMLDREVGDVTESDTVMRVLERNAEISTRYGGGFVQSIDGLAGEERLGRSRDWFFYVDGVESTVGAADYSLRGGESVWWDYRDWSAAIDVPAVVGSWPQPLAGGYDGRRRPVAVECRGGGAACVAVRSRLAAAGARLAAGSPPDAIRVLVGPWARLRGDPAAAQLEGGPRRSGVFVGLRRGAGGYAMQGLGEDGSVARTFGPRAGLVAATRRGEAPPVWLVTGAGPAGVSAAAAALDAAHLRDRYAVVIEGGEETALPVR